MSAGNAESITYINMQFISQIDAQGALGNDENDKRICMQITELNDCLDGTQICGLSSDQIKAILWLISSL